MDWFVKAFIKASVSWLALGVIVGVCMAVHPTWTIYRTAHMHMMLLGFVTQMIYGVGYHVIPRFSGKPLYRPGAAAAHWWIANAGLALMVIGFGLRANGLESATWVLGTGGTLAGIGAYIFAFVIWRTMDGAGLTAIRRADGASAAPAPLRPARS